MNGRWPITSIDKVQEFPKVAMNDVWLTKEKLDTNFCHLVEDMRREAQSFHLATALAH